MVVVGANEFVAFQRRLLRSDIRWSFLFAVFFQQLGHFLPRGRVVHLLHQLLHFASERRNGQRQYEHPAHKHEDQHLLPLGTRLVCHASTLEEKNRLAMSWPTRWGASVWLLLLAGCYLATCAAFVLLHYLRSVRTYLLVGTIDNSSDAYTADARYALPTGGALDPDFELFPVLDASLVAMGTDVPAEIRRSFMPDLRDLAVPSNQGTCPSCWAHATAHMLTDAVALATNTKPILLSAQRIWSCSQANGGHACADNVNGYLSIALKWVQAAGVTYASSPTVGDDNPDGCKGALDAVFINDIRRVSVSLTHEPNADERETWAPQIELIKLFLATRGPCLVTFLAPPSLADARVEFTGHEQVYRSSLHPPHPETAGDTWNSYFAHTVELVGYHHPHATDRTSRDADYYAGAYWVLKNSWGTNWGYKGYFSLPMGENAYGVEAQVTMCNVRMRRDETFLALRTTPIYLALLERERWAEVYMYAGISAGAFGAGCVLAAVTANAWDSQPMSATQPTAPSTQQSSQ